jgi:putative transposase
MTFYRRNLLHWQPEGASIFLTWRLFGSLPTPQDPARNGCATEHSPGKRFKLLDNALDKSTTGPFWPKEPRIANSVTDVIRKGDVELSYFALHAFVVMPNHVHLLITPYLAIARIMNGIKGAFARQANAFLGHKGQPFWQDESFDHWVRNSNEFRKIQTNIEYNPVFAGFVSEPTDWRWSSAGAPPAGSVTGGGTAIPGCGPTA